jgi:membrane protease YdiL (CAAX protease family)
MNKLKTYAFEKPVIFSIILIIVIVSFTFIPMAPIFSPFLDHQSCEYVAGIFEQVFASLVLIMILKRFNLLKSAGFTSPKQWKDLWIIWPMLLFALLNGSDLFSGNIIIDKSKPLVIVLFILVYLSTGLFEEILCRGVVLSLMLHKWGNTKKGCYLALVLSSALFGFTHIIHFILNQSSLLATVTQITYGTFIGVFFAACVLRNKTIYPAIILHAVVDIFGDLNEIAINGGLKETYFTMSIGDALGCIIITLPILIYGLFIFRKVTPSDLSIYTEEKFTMI